MFYCEAFPRWRHRTLSPLTPVASTPVPPSSLQTTPECPVLDLGPNWWESFPTRSGSFPLVFDPQTVLCGESRLWGGFARFRKNVLGPRGAHPKYRRNFTYWRERHSKVPRCATGTLLKYVVYINQRNTRYGGGEDRAADVRIDMSQIPSTSS